MSRNDFGQRFGEPKQYYGNFPDGRRAMKRGGVARGCGRILKERKKVTKVF